MTVQDLPAINATLNALSACFLVIGYVCIRRRQVRAHAAMMIGAFLTSVIFLGTYVTHKILVKGVHTAFAGTGYWRGVYYFILLTHVVLAMAIVPMALVTLYRAWRRRFDQHRKIARITWPVWIYVSTTGVLVYLMLYRWFPD